MPSAEHLVADRKSNLGRSHQCQLAIDDNGERQVVAHKWQWRPAIKLLDSVLPLQVVYVARDDVLARGF